MAKQIYAVAVVIIALLVASCGQQKNAAQQTNKQTVAKADPLDKTFDPKPSIYIMPPLSCPDGQVLVTSLDPEERDGQVIVKKTDREELVFFPKRNPSKKAEVKASVCVPWSPKSGKAMVQIGAAKGYGFAGFKDVAWSKKFDLGFETIDIGCRYNLKAESGQVYHEIDGEERHCGGPLIEPQTVRFQSYNPRYVGARFTITNSDGAVAESGVMASSNPRKERATVDVKSPGNLKNGYTVVTKFADGQKVKFEMTRRLSDSKIMTLDFGIAECAAHTPRYAVNGFPSKDGDGWVGLFVWPNYQKAKYPNCEH